MIKPANKTTSKILTTGFVAMKWAARLKLSLEFDIIKVRFKPRCTRRNFIKNNPISDMMTFFVIDEYIIIVLSDLF
jgi:hypothetical protein